jgi:hypothetical protein
MAKVETPEKAIELANKIAKYAVSKDFKPFSFESDFKKPSSDRQREYYWAVIIKMQYAFFKNNILKFCEFVFKVSRQSLSQELIHTINKILYNNGKSTEKLKSDTREAYHLAIREDMLHFCELDIPLPNEPSMDLNSGEIKDELKNKGVQDEKSGN